MRRAAIEDQNRYMLDRQRRFRVAADVVTDAWMAFAEVRAVALIGSVAKALWKEVPRFRELRRERIEIWHECRDLDMALWIGSQERLGELRRAGDRALRAAYEAGTGISVVGHQLDVFLIEPGSDRYLGRLCSFSQCPKACRSFSPGRLRDALSAGRRAAALSTGFAHDRAGLRAVASRPHHAT